MSELPEGWQSVKIGNVLKLINGFPFKPSQWSTKGLPIIRIQNLNDPEAPFNYCEQGPPERYKVGPGDLLFAWSGTPGTSFGAHIWRGADAWLNQHIYRVEPPDALFDRYFLRHAINHNLDDYIRDAHGGAGLAHITKSKFEASHLLLPPIPEQCRIVAKLDALLSRVNGSRQRLNKIPKLLARFRQSVLAAACSGRLTADWRSAQDIAQTGADVPRSWKQTPLRNLALSITDGDHQAPPKSQSGVPFVVISNLKRGTIDLSNTRHVPEHYYRSISEERKPKPGDILFTVTGSYGITVIVKTDLPFCFQRHIALIRPNPSINTNYLHLALSAEGTLKQAAAVATGTAQMTVPLSGLRAILISEPPLPEQQEIVRRVDQLFAFADRLEARVETARKRVDALTQSILAKAFRGELVPTEAELARAEGRSFESAAQLLERIATLNGRPTAQQARSPRKRNPKT